MDRGNFLVSQSNREALLWIERWPEWPGHALAISGPPGCGKSHLATIWRGCAAAASLKPFDLDEINLPRLLHGGGNLVIEDASALAGQAGFERALFHLHNALKEAGRFLLLTDSHPPARWPVSLPDLRSRLAAMPCIAVAPPDDHLLAALFGKLFADRQVKVSPEVVAYLVPRMERSFAEANRLTARLDAIALSRGGAITIAVARMALEENSTA